jgi:hypothetical protein
VSWEPVFLGVIALATLVMAAIQVGAIVYGARLAARVERLAEQVEREIRPLVARANGIAEEAARATALAARQVERVDRLMVDFSLRVDETAAAIQDAIVTPAREGLALFAGIRAGLAALRTLRDRRGSRAEEEDALFIG